MKNKGQAAMEYMTIVGLSLLLVSGGMYLFFGLSDSFKLQTTNTKLDEINLRLSSSIDRIKHYGEGSRITEEVIFPQGIEKFGILSSQTETYLVYVLFNNDTSIYDVSINLTCTDNCQINNSLHEHCTINLSFVCYQFSNTYIQSGSKTFRFELNSSQVEVKIS
jgi:hypothetical protein